MGEVSLGGGAQTNIRTVTTHGGGESWGRGSNKYQNSYNSWGRGSSRYQNSYNSWGRWVLGEGLKQISEQLQLLGEGPKQISEQLQLMGEVSLGGGESWGRISKRYQDSYNSWGM